jgi:RimJ/RimL family protein N-acetyltransferase
MDRPETRLSDGVISLAPYAPADAVTLMHVDADPEIRHWFDWPLTPPGNDPATYKARLASAESVIESKSAAWDAGREFAFIIHSVETGEGLGWVALAPHGSGRGSVSYGVLPAHRRQSAATRSVLLVSRYAFDVLGWTRLEIQAIADNIASRRVAVKAGFQLEGVLRSYGAFEKYQPLLGRRFDWAIYGKLGTDG